ncbi:hypothetical protein RHMOL_Rhmol02G0171600 [Rhododendron molle]|uniref:Uncharacterized protein n=1 Tax=Rhododendron molle TaxID=49168 RepID=A0ACC0PSJ8_RHOML|nr:hypothetical protein RHMOL_Rhmol02G0171600 [Rhododendron molle]
MVGRTRCAEPKLSIPRKAVLHGIQSGGTSPNLSSFNELERSRTDTFGGTANHRTISTPRLIEEVRGGVSWEGNIFETRDALLDWVRRVGKENDFMIVISKSASIKGNKMPKCILICERGGLYKPLPEGHSMQKITGTKKCDYPFKLRGVAQPLDGVMWNLKVDTNFYNHEPAEIFEGQEYPSRLTPVQQQLVRDMSSSTVPQEILSFMRQQDSSISTGIRRIYNVKALYKKKQLWDLSSIAYIQYDCFELPYSLAVELPSSSIRSAQTYSYWPCFFFFARQLLAMLMAITSCKFPYTLITLYHPSSYGAGKMHQSKHADGLILMKHISNCGTK